MLGYLAFELLRTVRDRRYLILSLGVPVIMFMMLSTVYGDEPDTAGGLSGAAYLLVGFGVYGAMGAALSSTGPRLAMELQTGWLSQLRITPLRAWKLIAAKAGAAMLVSLPSLLVVGLLAATTRHVSLPPAQWLKLLAVGWLGMLPFAALGTMIGSYFNGDSAQPATMLTHLVMSLVGGLWIPLELLPGAIRDIARWTPATRLAELGWDVAGNHPLAPGPILVLMAWTAVLSTLAALLFRRATTTP